MDRCTRELSELNERLLQIMAQPNAVVSITYFIPDEKKSGGRYEQADGVIKKIDEIAKVIVMDGGEKIPLSDIIELNEK